MAKSKSLPPEAAEPEPSADPMVLQLPCPDHIECMLRDAELPVAPIADLSPDQRVDRYIELAKYRARLEAMVEDAKSMMDVIEPMVVSHFQELGQQSVNRRNRTVYLAQEFWPKVDSKPDLIGSLRDSPSTSFLVQESVNTHSLRSFMLKEFKKDPLGVPQIPDHIRGMSITEKYRARVVAG